MLRRKLSLLNHVLDQVKLFSTFTNRTAVSLLHVRSAVRRQGENYLLALLYHTTDHAFDWTRTSVVGNGPTDGSRWVKKPEGTASDAPNIFFAKAHET